MPNDGRLAFLRSVLRSFVAIPRRTLHLTIINLSLSLSPSYTRSLSLSLSL
jgi:hypothetical protein